MAKRTPLIEVYGLRESKPKSLAETLSRIREVLSDKKNWIKGYEFADAKGHHVNSKDAKRVCLLGACALVDGRFEGAAKRRILAAIKLKCQWGRDIELFNDDQGTRHKDVLEVLDLAIEG